MERHVEKLASYSNVPVEFAKAFCNAWNIKCGTDYKLYIKSFKNLQRSILYLPLIVNGDKYLIPIGTLNKKLNGSITVKQGEVLFDIARASKQLTTTNNTDCDITKMRYGTIYNQSKVFSPDNSEFGDSDSGIYYKEKCERFKKNSNGKTFTAWSAIDILTDEDFEQIWLSKQTNTTRQAWYTNTEIQQNKPFADAELEHLAKLEEIDKEKDFTKRKIDLKNENDDFEKTAKSLNPEGTNTLLALGRLNNRKDGSDGDKVRAPIVLFENHRTISLQDALNVTWIVKYISGLNYTILNSYQQSLFSGNSRPNAVNYVKGILGDFEYDLLKGGSALEQSQINAKNIGRLKTEYKLFVPAVAKHLFNSILLATQDATNSNWLELCTQFEDNIFELIQRKVQSQSGNGNINSPCLSITFTGNEHKSHQYLVKYNPGRKVYEIYAKIRDLNGKDDRYAWENKPFTTVSALGVVPGGKTLYSKLEGIVDAINATTKNNDIQQKIKDADGKSHNVPIKFSNDNLRNSSILFEIKNEVTNSKTNSKKIYNLMDWDLMFHFFKKLNILDFDKFEECLKSTYFKGGLRLNDAKSFIADRSKTSWADLRVSNSTINARYSNIYDILPPIYKMDMSSHAVKSISNIDEELFEETTSHESNEGSTILELKPLEIKEKIVNLFLNGGIDVTEILSDDIFEKMGDMSENEILEEVSKLLSKTGYIENNQIIINDGTDYQIVERSEQNLDNSVEPNNITEETLESKIKNEINEKFENATDIQINVNGDELTVQFTDNNNGLEYNYTYIKDVGLIQTEKLAQFDILVKYGIINPNMKISAIDNFIKDFENFISVLYDISDEMKEDKVAYSAIQNAIMILDNPNEDHSNMIIYC